METLVYGNETDDLYKYRVLMDYVDMGYYDEITKAKIYPKIVYYYLKKQISFQQIRIVKMKQPKVRLVRLQQQRLPDFPI